MAPLPGDLHAERLERNYLQAVEDQRIMSQWGFDIEARAAGLGIAFAAAVVASLAFQYDPAISNPSLQCASVFLLISIGAGTVCLGLLLSGIGRYTNEANNRKNGFAYLTHRPLDPGRTCTRRQAICWARLDGYNQDRDGWSKSERRGCDSSTGKRRLNAAWRRRILVIQFAALALASAALAWPVLQWA